MGSYLDLNMDPEPGLDGEYRIENIQKARLNGKNVKLFKAFEYDESVRAYLYCGRFSAPLRTADADLHHYIGA